MNSGVEFYPESIPIGHLLRLDYPTRWFRIHSLPESKRYADDKDEWIILLYRQNTLITDLIGLDSEFYLVTGRFTYSNSNLPTFGKEYYEFECFRTIDFCESDTINLSECRPEDYDEEDGTQFIPASVMTTWKPGAFDGLLKAIANDQVRAMFVGISRRVIVAPYDGGVDCILENAEQVEYCKNKYQNWMSRLESEL